MEKCKLDEREGETVRSWDHLAVSRVKSPLPRFASDSGPHIKYAHPRDTHLPKSHVVLNRRARASKTWILWKAAVDPDKVSI